MPLPIEIIGLGRRELTVVWDESHEGTYPARDLRLRCRCAHCVHELTGAKLLDPSAVPADVAVTGLELMGNYGLRVEFSDGHGTGIYRFDELRARCPCPTCRARES
jgi:ATP-binding protein involved in chromosome partitioning